MIKSIFAAVAVASLAASSALAGGYYYKPDPLPEHCFKFDLRGNGGKKYSYEIESKSGGQFVDVYAKSEKPNGDLIDAKVDQDWTGMGVKHRDWDTSSQIEGRGYLDILFFDFGKDVEIGKIKFTHVDYNDDVTFVDYNNVVIVADGVPLDDIDIDKWGYIDLSVYNLTIDVLGIKADHKHDDFRVKSIEVCHPKLVPSPTAAGLGLVGAVSLLVRRRRSA